MRPPEPGVRLARSRVQPLTARQTIAAGWLTLCPFTPADIPWVYEVSLDPVLQRFMQVPSPYRLGVATTAVRAACRWAVTTAGIELIEWRCEAGNIASRRVAEKAGFLIEATLRKRRVRHGVRVDEWVGSLLRDEVMADLASALR